MSSRRASQGPRASRVAQAAALAVALAAGPAAGAEPTPGYPEPVVQWGVQKGETCEDIAKTLYGSVNHVGLLHRYNRVTCVKGAPLAEGTTLVLPAQPTSVPDARVRSMNPAVRARPPAGGWEAAVPGQPLVAKSSVNTLDQGRADIEFVDRTRVFMASNTLVVIYGTANQTRVSKTAPTVEIDTGEVKAGLAALRGGAVEVAVRGGGRIQAESRDSVVQRKGDRTTVAVFDGKAAVSSGGKTVRVPRNFGTRFVGVSPPVPPRPLPPAPAWARGSPEVVIGVDGAGTLDASWKPVPDAILYRFEVARDEGFSDLVVREEVPANVASFHAEKMPPGTYYLAVRAIDREEYLGVASARLPVEVVAATWKQGRGRVEPAAIEASPYGALGFGAAPDVELALDDGAFAPLPERLDFAAVAPKRIRLRRRGSEAAGDVALSYARPSARIEARVDERARAVLVRVALEGLDGVDVGARVAPRLRSHHAGGIHEDELAAAPGGGWIATVPVGTSDRLVRFDVTDARGRVLGTTDADVTPPRRSSSETAAAARVVAPMPRIGVVAPPWPLAATTSAAWWSPTAPDAIVVGATAGTPGQELTAVGEARATGSIGPLGLEAAVRSEAAGSASGADDAAWFGLRWRAMRRGLAALEAGPALRLAVPVTSDGPGWRLEPGAAIGGVSGRVSWLADLGARVRLLDEAERAPVPSFQGFLLAGGTLDLAGWLRASAVVDAHAFALDGESAKPRGGLSLGLEAGSRVFGALALRASPWSDGDGRASAAVSVGLRAP